jgi:hypothetical protein
MNIWLRYVLGIGLLSGIAPAAQGQAAGAADSSLVAVADHRLRQQYAQAVSAESRLYNGPEYVGYVRRNTRGHRFFESDQPQPATITYAGATYTDVPLRYDLVRGQLVLITPGGGREMRLLNEQVTGFTLLGHSFIRVVTDSGGHSPVAAGFYDLLVDGPVQLLAGRHKILRERAAEKTIESEITARTDYFVRKDHQYYRVDKAAALLRLFPENKAALRRYIKDQQLRFRPATREQALGALVRYQGQLNTARKP